MRPCRHNHSDVEGVTDRRGGTSRTGAKRAGECDGLTGLPEAIEATWPQATVQTCVGACPVFCVSVLQVGVDSIGVGGGELGQGLVPVGGDLPFDELALGPALGCWQSFLLVAFSGSFVHRCRRSPAFGSLTTASSKGEVAAVHR